MKTLYKMILAAGMVSAAFGASAQALRTAYFSDSYIYRHNMNPALANDDGYFAIPILGNTRIDMGMNFGVGDFIKDGPGNKSLIALNPNVPNSDFLDGLKKQLELQQELDLTLLSFGTNSLGGYTTFEIGLHEMANLQLDRNLFVFLKELDSSKRYSFTDNHLKGRAWGEIAMGHSHPIGDYWRVGAKLKLLVGIGYAEANINNVSASYEADQWNMRLDGDIRMGLGKTGFKSDSNRGYTGIGEYSPSMAGLGYGIDLGASYDMQEIVDGLKLSASLLNMGNIRWYDCANASNRGDQAFSFRGLPDLYQQGEGAAAGTIDEQWSDMHADLRNLLNFEISRRQSISESLAPTFCLGAEYELPAYNPISFGLLYTQRYSDSYGFTELRAVANYAPSRIFDMAVSTAVSSYGASVGGMLNLHLSGPCLFIGTDFGYFNKFDKNMLPLEGGGLSVQVGLSFAMGRNEE